MLDKGPAPLCTDFQKVNNLQKRQSQQSEEGAENLKVFLLI